MSSLRGADFCNFTRHHDALSGFDSPVALLEQWEQGDPGGRGLVALRELIAHLQTGNPKALVPNLLLCMLTPLVKKSMRSTNTALNAPDLVQEALMALFEELASLPEARLRSARLMAALQSGVRSRLLSALADERKAEIARQHLQRYDAVLLRDAQTKTRPSRRKRCRMDAEERLDCRALLATLEPTLLKSEGVEVWIATTIEGRSFREVALSMGGANGDTEVAQLEGRLRQRKCRAAKKIQNFLNQFLADGGRPVGNDDREIGISAALLQLFSSMPRSGE